MSKDVQELAKEYYRLCNLRYDAWLQALSELEDQLDRIKAGLPESKVCTPLIDHYLSLRQQCKTLEDELTSRNFNLFKR